MTPLRQRMIEDMQLRDLSEPTQEMYARAVRQLAEHYGKSPAQISDEELRQYFLYLKNVKKRSRSTCTIALCALKFLYEQTLKCEMPTLTLVRPAPEHKLPVVLSREEVHRILGSLGRPHYRVCLSTIYSCGLAEGKVSGCRSQTSIVIGCSSVYRTERDSGTGKRFWLPGRCRSCVHTIARIIRKTGSSRD